ncbi:MULTISPECIES: tyrosine recombinase XerS [Lacticaseibacillus]|uniref:Tyrosine recombinase XerS n=2 Tax=Lacticaseibacillus zeae TaxID=57037 RepID=A0ABD7ZDK4_LACZE|nr:MULTISPECIES: tyrosine recombinase XerS [Lacticaseibacillus]OFR95224.1 recombinase XerS [Lactobacillus sp. HMSC068F07]MDE3282386.1 tyrosine recombinase XerS [Lacticaseibacillus casei]MDE3315153.1 tyrosine recombinase XerS [Lacticaseibacillus zeae]WLV84930.1 tyrosine recombinase XerS [Lacticaseibacillus sp. NCIMB 15475]WLV85279.1 tyrosine recombinase XerS [Lacticaseibacillus sp. NCIMB 15474]
MSTQNYPKLIHAMLPSLPDYIQDYYHSQKAIPIADSTLYQYLHFYQEFLDWLIASGVTSASSPQSVPLETLEHLSLRDAQAFMAYLLERPSKTHPNKRMTRRSVALRLVGIKALYRFLTEESEPHEDGEPYFYRNVWNKVKLKTHAETTAYRNHKLQEMLFVDGEDAKFLHWLDQVYAHQLPSKQRAYFEAAKHRNLAIIALLFGSGVRVSELVNMNLEDLNMDRHTVQVVRKGNFQDRVNFADWIDPYLTAYLQQRAAIIGYQKPTSPLFVTQVGQTVKRIRQNTIEAFFKRYTTAYGRPSTPHKARHTLGTNIYTVTKDVQQVADQLGQTTTSATDLYINLSDKRGKAALREVSETAAKALDRHTQQPHEN